MKRMKIYCLGDSLTAGYGVPRGRCWRDLAMEETGCGLINGGVNGDASSGMLHLREPGHRLMADAFIAALRAAFPDAVK